MTPLSWRYSSRAAKDMTAILLDLAKKNAQAAENLTTAVDATLSLISRNPQLGEAFNDPSFPNVRRTLVTGHSTYSVYYQWSVDGLRILRVLHNSRLVRLSEDA